MQVDGPQNAIVDRRFLAQGRLKVVEAGTHGRTGPGHHFCQSLLHIVANHGLQVLISEEVVDVEFGDALKEVEFHEFNQGQPLVVHAEERHEADGQIVWNLIGGRRGQNTHRYQWRLKLVRVLFGRILRVHLNERRYGSPVPDGTIDEAHVCVDSFVELAFDLLLKRKTRNHARTQAR